MLIGISGYIGSGKDTVAEMIQYLNSPFDKERKLPFFPNDNYENRGSWQIKKFAGKLKQMVSLMTGIPVKDLEKQEVKDSFLGDEWGWWTADKAEYRKFGSEEIAKDWCSWQPSTLQPVVPIFHRMTVRELLQTFGTDAVRDVLHPNAWVNALMADYKGMPVQVAGSGPFTRPAMSTVYPNWVISDCRFPNEAEAVEARGGIMIRVNRPKPRLVSLQATDAAQQEHDRLGEVFAGTPHPSETALDNYKFKYTINNTGTLEELVEKVRFILKQEGIL